jgi:hypothetical protein
LITGRVYLQNLDAGSEIFDLLGGVGNDASILLAVHEGCLGAVH